MSQLSETQILSKPTLLFTLLSTGDEVRIVADDGHLLGTVAPAPAVRPKKSTPPKPDMKAWAADIKTRLQRRFGSRVVPDSLPMLDEMRADRF